jgi:nucleotidyltransferase substrate binding protein (TIGR01987 family)
MANAQWIVDDFAAALAQLKSALAEPADRDLIKAGSIQYFEFSFELGWKACKVVSAEQGLPDCLSPKACLRQAFTQGWIGDEAVWLEMLDARNRMAHTYDARKALQIYESLPQFCAALQKLLVTLQSLIKN